jgi:hypothetical protein
MSGDDIEPGSANEQRRYEEKSIAPPQVWKHTKTGKMYSIVVVSKHSETLEELITYRLTNSSKEFWTRPRSMFLDFGGPDGSARFTRIR